MPSIAVQMGGEGSVVFKYGPRDSIFVFGSITSYFSFRMLFPVVYCRMIRVIFNRTNMASPSRRDTSPRGIAPTFVGDVSHVVNRSKLSVFYVLPVLCMTIVYVIVSRGSIFNSSPWVSARVFLSTTGVARVLSIL